MNKPITKSPDALVAVVWDALGNHPEDIMSMVRNASDVLLTLSNLLWLMGNALDRGDIEEAQRHIRIGQYLAESFGENADTDVAEMKLAMDKAGIKHGVDHE